MGLFGTLIGFGAGYVAGMRLGDKPVTAVRDAMGQAKERATTVASQASETASRTMGAVESALPSSVDVRSVREVMTPAPKTVEVSATLADAARIMEKEDIGSVIVTESGKVAGIVTDRDIAIRAIAVGKDPSTTKASEAMTRSPVTIEPTATVQEAIDVMRRRDVRRVPVVEDGRPVGVVSLADVAATSQARSVLADISAAPPNN